jgi:hypothetical protein
MPVAFGTWVKARVSIAELLYVQRLAYHASQQASFFKRLRFVWRIIVTLTERRTLLSLFHYAKILQAINAKPDAQSDAKTIEQIEAQVLRLCADIGSRAHKLPHEVAQGMTFEEVDLYYRNLLLRRLEEAMDAVSAHHAPVDFAKRAADKIRELHNQIAYKETSKGSGTFEPVKIRDMFPRFA